jgi:triacylglycerol lipase
VKVADDAANALQSKKTWPMVAPELAPALERFPRLDLSDDFIAQLRSGQPLLSGLEGPPLSVEQAAVACDERFIPGLGGAPDLRLLVYTPPGAAAAPRAAFLHMHGGGYVLGSADLNDGSNRSMAAELDCIVVSVDYRLAPETRFPGAVEDGYAALQWLHGQAEMLGVDRGRIALGGESAGGGHAAALAIYARDRGEIPILFQALDSPMLDDRTGSTADPHPYCGEFVWPAANNRYGWGALLGIEPGGPQTPYGAAPARVADLAGLPPAFVVVGTLDLFMEESLEYARRLIRAGVPAELHLIPGAYHGFGAAGVAAPQVQTLLRLRNAALARAFNRA